MLEYSNASRDLVPAGAVDVSMRLAFVLAVLIHANECEPFEVNVHLQVDRSIASRVMTAALEDETESLWRPYGVRIDWADARHAEVKAHRFSLEAILEPVIQELDLPTWPTVLGRVAVEPDGASARPIRVSFDATEKVLGPRTNNQALIVRDHEVARALGRVLAHEIGHVLLGVFHDKAGLMRATFRSNELAERSRGPFHLTRADVGRLTSRIPALAGIEHEPTERQICIQGHATR